MNWLLQLWNRIFVEPIREKKSVESRVNTVRKEVKRLEQIARMRRA